MAFDLNSFMNATADSMDTSYPVCPEGEWPFLLDADPKMLEVKHISGVSDRTGNAYDFHQIELIALCQSDKVKAEMGRDKVPVRIRCNLDFDVNGRLSTEKGKNVLLGQIREAVKQNTPGWKPAQLLGAGPFLGRVKQTEVNGRKYADIVAVAPMK